MILAAIVFGACAIANENPVAMSKVQESADPDKVIVKRPFDSTKWTLEWADEFDKGTAPDPRFWSYEVGYLRNDEKQFYTKDRRENARIENGMLVIEARKDDFEKHPITSASLVTYGKRPFLYGRVEVRAKVPTGRGTWPAAWLLGENVTKVDWPNCGEIDIMENVGYDPQKIHGHVHTESFNWVKHTDKGNVLDAGKPWEDFHVYAIEWYTDRIEFLCDDTRYFVFHKRPGGDAVWPFDKPQYLILNLAIGGGWGGQKGVDESLFPHKYLVDFVRYYKLKS